MLGPIFWTHVWGGECWTWRGETVPNYRTRAEAYQGWRQYAERRQAQAVSE